MSSSRAVRCSSICFCLSILAAFGSALFPVSASAQSINLPDTVHITLGQSDSLAIELQLPLGARSFDARMHLSNPTVYFPLHLSSGGNTLDSALKRRDDSTYDVHIDAADLHDDSLVLHGVALSGNDSVCTLTLRSVHADSIAMADDSTLLIEQSTGTPPGVYLRFAFVSEAWPNPGYDDVTIRWNLRFDLGSLVTFRVYDAIGRVVHESTADVPVGPSVFELSSDGSFYPGIYTLVVSASSGSAQRRFVLMR